jgi:hypothetical protein
VTGERLKIKIIHHRGTEYTEKCKKLETCREALNDKNK